MPTELPNEFYPLLAGYYDESDFEAYRSMWREFRELPEFSRNLLTSGELPLALKTLAERFDFDQSTATFVSVLVRKIIFREWDETQSRAEFAAWCQEFDTKNTPRCEEIMEMIKSDVLTIVPKEEEKAGEEDAPVTIHVTLLEALSKYPQLGQQTITETRIKLKTSTELVRGSLTNWLKCYREELGVGYHDTISRGQFLFRSQNGLRLTNEEHRRIEILLRSIEDRETVEVDTAHQVIVFPLASGLKNPQSEQARSVEPETLFAPLVSSVPMPAQMREKQEMPVSFGETGSSHVFNGAQLSPSNQTLGTLHFSSRHVLPVEKEIQLNNQGVEKNLGTILPGKTNVTMSPGTPAIQTKTVSAVVNNPLHPMPAPRRDVNSNYIPKPYRIDPTKRDAPEKEE